MKKRIFLQCITIASLAFMIILLVVGCGEKPKGEDAKPSEGNLTTYEGAYRFDSNGWVYLHIEGEPYQRGFQHGYLLAPELEDALKTIKYTTLQETGKNWDYFVAEGEKLFMDNPEEEFIEEIKGIADGARAAGLDTTWQEVLAWNGYSELTDYWWPNEEAGDYSDQEHCSAFVATGSYTSDGGVVMAHNSWEDFVLGQFFNVILDIQPSQGQRMFMQAVPGYIDSFTDFFVTGAGIMGTETTIGGYSDYDPNEEAEFFRVRKAMQYANNLDEFVQLMQKKNNGGYANSWLFADINTSEIMRFEQGLKYQNVERTKDGYFVGCNAPFDPVLRNLECSDTGFFDIRMPAGARRVRLTQLMEEQRGEIDIEEAKKILADHYDVYLDDADNPGSRTVDGHYELDPFEYWHGRQPYMPKGAVDGKVMDSQMARALSFSAIFGNSSGMPFVAQDYFEEHPQWNYLQGYLKDRPTQPWTLFTVDYK
jgi:Phospholipase B